MFHKQYSIVPEEFIGDEATASAFPGKEIGYAIVALLFM